MIWFAITLYFAIQSGPTELNISPILVDNVCQLAPNLDVAKAQLHARSAQAAAHATSVEPELLLAIAYVESRFDPTAVSTVRGRSFCGVMQTIAGEDVLTCRVMRDLDVGYLAGAIELRSWLRLAHGDLSAALNGHGCGMAGMRDGCRHYAERVLAVRQRLVIRSGS